MVALGGGGGDVGVEKTGAIVKVGGISTTVSSMIGVFVLATVVVFTLVG